MKYYKFIDSDGNETFQSHVTPVIRPEMVEITEDEYNAEIIRLQQKAQEELNEIEQSKDDYIAELEATNAELTEVNSMLEAENAALLFQNLTGEDFIL